MGVKLQIGILISFGFAERNLKCVRLAELLIEAGYKVDLNQDIERTGKIPSKLRMFKFWLMKRLMHRFGEIQGFKKFIARKELREEKNDLSDRYDASLGWPFPHSNLVFRLLHWLFRGLPSTIRKDYQPDMVVLTDLQFLLAQNVIKHCERYRIPIVAINASWDHLTHRSQAIDGPELKKFLVWNEIQVEEALRIHGIPQRKLGVIGAMQFDALHRSRSDFDPHKIRERYMVSPTEKILFLPAYTIRLGEREPAVISHILDSLDVIDRVRVIIRPYPTDSHFYTRFADVLSHPRVSVAELNPDNPDEDFRSMSELLYVADVILTGCSTAAIEAMYYDTPVIHLGIDEQERIGNQVLFKKYFFSDHYRHIMKHRASFYVQTYAELLSSIQTYLDDPGMHRDERRLVVDEQIRYQDGKSGERIVAHINEVLAEASIP